MRRTELWTTGRLWITPGQEAFEAALLDDEDDEEEEEDDEVDAAFEEEEDDDESPEELLLSEPEPDAAGLAAVVLAVFESERESVR